MASRQNTLSKADDFKLMVLMTEELPTYTDGVGAFVAYARDKLGIPHLNKDHVYFRAKELDIKLPERPASPLRAAVVANDPRVDGLQAQFGEFVAGTQSAIDELRRQVKQLHAQIEVIRLAAKHNKS